VLDVDQRRWAAAGAPSTLDPCLLPLHRLSTDRKPPIMSCCQHAAGRRAVAKYLLHLLTLLQGPFSARELRGWVASGQLPADMPVWHSQQPEAQYMLGTLLGAADAAAARWRRIALPHVPRISAPPHCRLFFW
jgi:hypothetical protein